VDIGIGWGESCPLTSDAIQYFANLACQRIRCERLLEENRAWLQQTVVDDGMICIPGHVENFRFRMKWCQMFGQLPAAHLGHHHIGQQQMNVFFMPPANLQRVICSLGLNTS